MTAKPGHAGHHARSLSRQVGGADSKAIRPGHPGRTRLPNGSTTFALFSEVLVVGVVILLLSIPAVTALPAVTAGVVHLRRHLAGEPDRVVDLLALFLAACRGSWLVSLGSVAAALVLGFNIWLVGADVAPVMQGPALVSAIAGLALLVVLLRASGRWAPGTRWWPTVVDAAQRSRADARGSTLLVVAIGLSALCVWMLLPLALVVGGLLSLAVVAVEHRVGSGLQRDGSRGD